MNRAVTHCAYMDKSAALIDEEIRQPSASRYGSFAEWVLAPAVIAALLIAIIRLEATGQAARSPWSILLASFCVGLLVVAYANYTRQCRCLAMFVRSKSL